MDIEPMYKELKAHLCKAVRKHDLEPLKIIFCNDIQSNRSMSRVETVSDLLDLLEVRDLLDSHNVTALRYLVEALKNDSLLQLVRNYQKLYLSEDGYSCICGLDSSYTKTENTLPLPLMSRPCNNENKTDNKCLDETVEILAKRLGDFGLYMWCDFVREFRQFGVPLLEWQIDHIRQQHPDDEYKQAKMAFQFWIESYPDKANVDLLIKTLDSRLCRIKGLGSFLIRPVLGLTHKSKVR